MIASTVTTSRVVAVVLFAGLTVVLTGKTGDRLAYADEPGIEANAAVSFAAGPSNDVAELPIQLAMDKKKTAAEDPFAGEPQAGDPFAGDPPVGDPFGGSPKPKAKPGYRPSGNDVIDMKETLPAEQRIRAALDEPTELEFIEQPLQDVIGFLKDIHMIEIQIDQRALDDVGIASDTPITRALKGISLRSALRLMLRDLELTYVIRDEVMLITSVKEAEAMLETHVYSLDRLPDFESETLAQAVRNAVWPDTWRTNGSLRPQPYPAGTSEPPRRGAVEAFPGCLVITHNQRAHEEIAELFRQLEAFVDRDGRSTGR